MIGYVVGLFSFGGKIYDSACDGMNRFRYSGVINKGLGDFEYSVPDLIEVLLTNRIVLYYPRFLVPQVGKAVCGVVPLRSVNCLEISQFCPLESDLRDPIPYSGRLPWPCWSEADLKEVGRASIIDDRARISTALLPYDIQVLYSAPRRPLPSLGNTIFHPGTTGTCRH